MSRKTFHRETPESRRQDLIDATLTIIGQAGFAAATVRAISNQADVTQGLIRHYFKTKEDLISAAYEHHMSQMTDLALAPLEDQELNARQRLRDMVMVSVGPKVMNARNLTLWATFIAKIHSAEEIRQTHERTYLRFRNALGRLIGDALQEAGQVPQDKDIRAMAVQCNAVLDGLWIEGAAMPGDLGADEVTQYALRSVERIVGLKLG